LTLKSTPYVEINCPLEVFAAVYIGEISLMKSFRKETTAKWDYGQIIHMIHISFIILFMSISLD
jgi:hypothetical protein